MNLFNDKEREIIHSHPFAQILSSQPSHTGFAELSYCPLQLLNNNLLLGHLARNNPLLKVLNSSKNAGLVKVIFTGPQGYISPRWHSEQIVPTWNYASVSLICQMNLIENSEDKLMAMKTISHYFDPQWRFNEFDNEKNHKMVQQMVSAITVFELEVVEVSSKFKLSQNRSMTCRQAFQENLQQVGNNELAELQLC